MCVATLLKINAVAGVDIVILRECLTHLFFYSVLTTLIIVGSHALRNLNGFVFNCAKIIIIAVPTTTIFQKSEQEAGNQVLSLNDNITCS